MTQSGPLRPLIGLPAPGGPERVSVDCATWKLVAAHVLVRRAVTARGVLFSMTTSCSVPRVILSSVWGLLRVGALVSLVVAAAGTLGARPAAAQEALPSIAQKTQNATRMEGFLDLYWSEEEGTLHWELDLDLGEFLYQISMGSGLGSNPVGIDRGQLRGTHVLEAKQIGPRVLLMEPNYRFQARSDNPEEVQAVRDAFAPSVYWGFDIEARTGNRVLVDATDFFLRDARGVIDQLRQRGQGTFRLDASRSAIHLPATRTFPDNTEVEALLTFTGDNPGVLVRGVAVNPRAVTLRQHHSFVRLPGPGYQPRIADPRIGVNGPTILDYATPIDEDMRLRLASRHRLQKRSPGQDPSEAVEPIIYYVDPGTPEPIRSALIEGASWWAEAFEAAGFVDAYRVEILPAGVDPQDIRYNMIHWTHRRTRGYSYGSTVTDPRTGEIIRGVVNLGSLRLRQDYLLGQGMVAPFGTEADASHSMGPHACGLALAPGFEYLAQVADNADAVQMALDRVRQLSAHEVGHTLGFPHNYLASAFGRESVMDYPAPYVGIDGSGDLDLSDAYVQRIGAYDKLSVDWLYREFPDGTDEKAALEDIVLQGIQDGLLFMAHPNNHFIGAGHQFAGVWDNGANLVDHLKHELEVRAIGLERFGRDNIGVGRPDSDLEFVLLPLYMHHRFQLRAAAQSLGGANYAYTLSGDGQPQVAIVPAAEQRDALETILGTLSADFLAIDPEVVAMIPPAAYRHGDGEVFDGRTGVLFDPLGAAEAAAAFTVGEILHPQRAARLVVYGSMGDYPGLEEVVDRLVAATWEVVPASEGYHRAVQRTVQRTVVDRMMEVAGAGGAMADVRAVLSDRLNALAGRLESMADASPHQYSVAADIRRWQRRIDDGPPLPGLELPAGDPIGQSKRGG